MRLCDFRAGFVFWIALPNMADIPKKQKVVIVGAGPVGSLAALYAAGRGDDVELYELRGGMSDEFFARTPRVKILSACIYLGPLFHGTPPLVILLDLLCF